MISVIDFIHRLAESEIKQLSVATNLGTREAYDQGTLTDEQKKNLATVLGYVNQAYQQVFRDFRLLSKRETLYVLKASPSGISLPADYGQLKRAKLKSQTESVSDVVLDKNNVLGVYMQRTAPFEVEVVGEIPPEYLKGSMANIEVEYIAEAPLLELDDDVELNAGFMPAMVNYTAYKGHLSVNGSLQGDNNTFLMRYRSELTRSSELGYNNELTFSSDDVLRKRGFV